MALLFNQMQLQLLTYASLFYFSSIFRGTHWSFSTYVAYAYLPTEFNHFLFGENKIVSFSDSNLWNSKIKNQKLKDEIVEI